MEKLERILGEHPFFADLDEGFRKLACGCAKNVRFEAGQYIFHEGDPGGIMYVIRSGRVESWLYDEDRQRVVLATFEEGDFFGELSLLETAAAWLLALVWIARACELEGDLDCAVVAYARFLEDGTDVQDEELQERARQGLAGGAEVF